MTIYSFSTDNNENKDIQNVLFSPYPKGCENITPEIEFRIGKWDYDDKYKTSDNPEGMYYKANVNYKEWNKIYSNVFNYKKYISLSHTDDIISMKGDYRKITKILPEGKDPMPVEYQRKIKQYDFINPKTGKTLYTKYDTTFNIITNFQTKGLDYNPYITTIRLAKGYEKTIKEEEYNSITGKRVTFQRERKTFEFQNFFVDFTIRNRIDGGENIKKYNIYEIEIEFKENFIKNIFTTIETKNSEKETFRLFMNECKVAFSCLFPKLNTLFTETKFNIINKQLYTTNQSLKNNNIKDIKPVNIQEKHISGQVINPAGLLDFSATNKLDGVGYSLTIIQNDLNSQTYALILYNKTDVFMLSQILRKQEDFNLLEYKNMICKCEVRFLNEFISGLSVKNQETIEINLYDCIFITKNPLISNEQLSSRVSLCNDIQSYLSNNFKNIGDKNLVFKVKPYFYSSSIKETLYNVVSYMNSHYGEENLTDTNDGIIFQYNGSYNKFPSLKWKFYSKITIDFTAEKYEQNLENQTTTYKLLSNQGKVKPPLNQINPSFIITVNNNDIIDGIEGNNLSGYVLECGYSVNLKKWFIHRIRFDKTEYDANYVSVAEETYYDIINELTLPILINKINYYRNKVDIDERGFGTETQKDIEKMKPQIKDKCLENYRKLHNKIKEKIIVGNSYEKTILDLGAGKGGDLPKYTNSNIKKLYAVEPNINNLNVLSERLEKTYKDIYNRVIKINAGGEDTSILSSKIFDKVDIVNMFFVLSFFFKDRQMLLNLVDTIDLFLNKNGLFIGTYIDGILLKQELQKGNIDRECYYIHSLNIDNKETENNVYGQKIEIDLKGTATATKQEEYLIFIEELFHLLAYRGIYMIANDSFENFAKSTDIELLNVLDNDEKYLNGFYKYFVCKKNNEKELLPVRNVPLICPIKGKIPEVFNEYWYRFSAPADGSCFFHSVGKAIMRNEYNEQAIRRMRENIASRLTMEDYIEIYQGEKAILDFQIVVLRTLSIKCFTKYPLSLTINTSGERLSSNLEQITNNLTKYISDMFDKIQTLPKDKKLNNVNEVISYLVNQMTSDGFVKEEVEKIFNAYKTYNYTQFYNEASNCESFAEEWMINYIQKLLKINIIIVHSNSMKPISISYDYDPNNVSIVIYNIENTHFEPIFKRTSLFDTNFQTTFSMRELINLFSEKETQYFIK
jgi:hypothetical protein